MKTRKNGHNFLDGVIDGLQSSKEYKISNEKMDFKLKGIYSDYSRNKPYFLLTSEPTFRIDNTMKLLGTQRDSLKSELDTISWNKHKAQTESKILEEQLFNNITALTAGSGNLINPYGAKTQKVIPLQIQELEQKKTLATLLVANQHDAIERVVSSDVEKNPCYFFQKMQIGLSNSQSDKSNLTSVTGQDQSSSIVDHIESTIKKQVVKNLIKKVDDVLPGTTEIQKVVNRVSFFTNLIQADTCKKVGLLTTAATMAIGQVALNRLPTTAIPLRTLAFLTDTSATVALSYGSIKLGELAEVKCREFEALNLNSPMRK